MLTGGLWEHKGIGIILACSLGCWKDIQTMQCVLKNFASGSMRISPGLDSENFAITLTHTLQTTLASHSFCELVQQVCLADGVMMDD